MPERVLANGVHLHWREAGDLARPPVVWIHGGSIEESSSMLPDLEPFFPRLRTLSPDTRGHGLSQTFERVEDYRYARRAEDMVLWLDALAIARAVFGGASMGGALPRVGGGRRGSSGRRLRRRDWAAPTDKGFWARLRKVSGDLTA